jgi:hypothetical protein
MSGHDIEVMRERIAAACTERDRHLRDGPEEHYVQSYVVVKALELELEEMLAQSGPRQAR